MSDALPIAVAPQAPGCQEVLTHHLFPLFFGLFMPQFEIGQDRKVVGKKDRGGSGNDLGMESNLGLRCNSMVPLPF